MKAAALCGLLLAVASHGDHPACEHPSWTAGFFGTHRATCECTGFCTELSHPSLTYTGTRCPKCAPITTGDDAPICGGWIVETTPSALTELLRRYNDAGDSYALVALLYLKECPFCKRAWPVVQAALSRCVCSDGIYPEGARC